jgi:serine/threonine protein kinase
MLQALGRGDEQVKIVDFGIAKIKESVIAPSTITGGATAGTIVYMSPEQLRGEKISATSDIYALGVIAYEMVTGRRPFNPETIAHLAEMQREEIRAKPSDLRPRLPKEAERIILKALAFDPKARYQDADEFGEALAHALMEGEETLNQWPREVVRIPPTELSEPEAHRPMSTMQSAPTLVTPPEPARTASPVQPIQLPLEPAGHKGLLPKLVVGLVVAIALLAVGYMVANREGLFGGGAKTNPVNAVARRSLAYSLTVQKMRDREPYKEPFESSGQEIFESGYKFRLNVASPQTGYLYVFNEGAEEKTGMSFTIIYPTPSTNNGSAKLDANQSMQTNWNTFAGQAGTEEFWIVWSASPVPQLEAARDAAFRNPEGALMDAAMVRTVKEFLTKHSDPKPETVKDTMNKRTDVHSSGDLLVKLVELEHR